MFLCFMSHLETLLPIYLYVRALWNKRFMTRAAIDQTVIVTRIQIHRVCATRVLFIVWLVARQRKYGRGLMICSSSISS